MHFRALRQSPATSKLLEVLIVQGLKRLALAVQLRPWTPSFQMSVPETWVTERSGDIGVHFRPEGVLQGVQSFFLQINIDTATWQTRQKFHTCDFTPVVAYGPGQTAFELASG